MGEKFTTPKFRIMYPHLFKPSAAKGSTELRYSVMMCFPKETTDMTEFKNEIKKAAKEKWGNKKPKGFKNPIKDGEDLEIEELEDYWCVKASTKFDKPGIVDAKRNIVTEEDSDEVYPGRWARAVIKCGAYENIGKGVTFYLQSIQLLGHADPFKGQVSDPRDDFDDYEEDDDNDDMDW